MYIVTTKQMQAAEKAADAAGISYDQMMENAGYAIAEAIMAEVDIAGVRVLVLVGPGNNGGDGLVVARHLAQNGAVVTVYVWKRNVEKDHNWALLENTGVSTVVGGDAFAAGQLTPLLNESAIIVDALLGTGVSRPISGTLAQLLDFAKSIVAARRNPYPQDNLLTLPAQPVIDNEIGPLVVAVDVPSGLNSDTGAVDPHTLPADITVTLAAVKFGHVLFQGPAVVGQLVVGEIGIAEKHYTDDVSLEMATAAGVAKMLPTRPPTAHKGTFGTAMLVSGAISYTGAAILAGQAATRIGTGLVTMAVPNTIHPVVASRLAEATYLPLPDVDGFVSPAAVEPLTANLSRATALLVGSGLGNTKSTAAFLFELLAHAGSLPPLVLDADALNILAEKSGWWKLLPLESVLTPHPGEMARLLGTASRNVQENRLDTAKNMAAQWGQIVLLKGAHTIVAAPAGRTMVLPFANPALAKAGSGDVLAGAIVGLLAQGMPPFEAAVAGAYLHGLAGELVREQVGAAASVAGDLVRLLPPAIREVTGE